jgi:hypothetical protein
VIDILYVKNIGAISAGFPFRKKKSTGRLGNRFPFGTPLHTLQFSNMSVTSLPMSPDTLALSPLRRLAPADALTTAEGHAKAKGQS